MGSLKRCSHGLLGDSSRFPTTPLPAAVELGRPRLEGGDHAFHRLGEQHPHGVLQQQGAEFELEREGDLRAAGMQALRDRFGAALRID